jgi:hypothetical protein
MRGRILLNDLGQKKPNFDLKCSIFPIGCFLFEKFAIIDLSFRLILK